MIYLTEIKISALEAAQSRSEFPNGLQDSYTWHQFVWKFFPEREKESRDFLTRLDFVSGSYRLFIVSRTYPIQPKNWTLEQCKTQEIPLSFFSNQHYRFQLRVNPTKKIRVGDTKDGTRKKNGKRIPLTKTEDLIAWLERKGESAGFIIQNQQLIVHPNNEENFVRHAIRGKHSSVDFQGVLTVTDSNLFLQTFIKGIGSSKAFGFGLLIMAPSL